MVYTGTLPGKEGLPLPWTEWKIMDQREQFVRDYLSGDYPKGCYVRVWHQPPDGGQIYGLPATIPDGQWPAVCVDGLGAG